MGLTVAAGTVALAQEVSPAPAQLATEISRAQSRIDELDAAIGVLRENVNRALVDLHDAQSLAEQSRQGADEARRRLEETQAEVERARAELGEVSRSQYRGLGSPSPIAGAAGKDAQQDVLDRSLYLRQQAEAKQSKLDEVERARTEAANEESTLRLAAERAERTAREAAEAENQARSTLEASEAELTSQLAQREAAAAEQEEARQQLDQVRPGAGSVPEQPGAEPAAESAAESVADSAAASQPARPENLGVDKQTLAAVEDAVAAVAPEAPAPKEEDVARALETALTAAPAADSGAASGLTPYAASAGGDAELSSEVVESLIANSPELTEQAAAIAAAAALVGSSQAAHSSFDNPYGGASSKELIAAFSSGLSSVLSANASSDGSAGDVSSVLPEVSTSEQVSDSIQSSLPKMPNSSQVETVIARAQSMIGTPYVWGGGDANGPTTGVDGGSVKGFDCSGLVVYAFAGVGISLPHYSGYQYQRGTQVDPSEAKRGDLFFYGAGGESHVAINLGDGTMIEAPQSGMTVRITPVRWSGMSPKAVRLL
ncbi:hypothetical protein C3E79_05680 [Corynebacterium liangguodongii]|uniref:Uncharacterized protein n=1 Tax=Corynebacterium liangguodongii TaxID=2079535 RepID=A0A2S0WH31_9CORY|nr:hypothetical protein C3E79_05680 [Corynebacterium liangguodongii]PWC00309.1 hypothetical protein DF219_02320 [Corynebacterium liangguodongii]